MMLRCSCGFHADTVRAASIHITKLKQSSVLRGDMVAPHSFVQEYVEIPIPDSPKPLDDCSEPSDNGDHQELENDQPPPPPQLEDPDDLNGLQAEQHEPDAGSPAHHPIQGNLQGAHVQDGVVQDVAPAQQKPPDFGPFRNWSSLQIARFYVDWNLSRSKLIQLVTLLHDKRFKSSDVNALFISSTTVNTVQKIMEREKQKYGLPAPVPFKKETFDLDGIEYVFFYRDLVQLALQLFSTSTTQEAAGFQYRATPQVGEHGRIYTSCSTGKCLICSIGLTRQLVKNLLLLLTIVL